MKRDFLTSPTRRPGLWVRVQLSTHPLLLDWLGPSPLPQIVGSLRADLTMPRPPAQSRALASAPLMYLHSAL